ncbi:PEP-CTERM sorting domain-containing protein [Nitrosospira sp. NpAV]|uniref:PEP-CTERM sorting domain-containing protein n=1 Tax=Nitrosospira sp. NpAV TaxID=58133 RepID=UPI0005A0E198|nr:hypothetical protein SQ11_07415 [Nitrosospira sp. NpAV]
MLKTIATMLAIGFLSMSLAHADSKNNANSGKAWTPPPGLLSDEMVSSLTFASDKSNNGNSNNSNNGNSNPGRGHVYQVPEPGTIILIGAGFLGLAASRRIKRRD